MRPHWWIAGIGIGIGNSFTTTYFGIALMYTLITQRGEVSGLVRILHQRLGYHMTKVTYISHCGYIFPTNIHTHMDIYNQSTDTTIILLLLYTHRHHYTYY